MVTWQCNTRVMNTFDMQIKVNTNGMNLYESLHTFIRVCTKKPGMNASDKTLLLGGEERLHFYDRYCTHSFLYKQLGWLALRLKIAQKISNR